MNTFTISDQSGSYPEEQTQKNLCPRLRYNLFNKK